jgi:hypothetical protein
MSRILIVLRSALLGLFLFLALPCRASIGLLVGEPFGSFGTMMPVGHASVYLDHLCAASPTHLRPCRPGEPGVVISRYHDLRISNLDWLATPVIPFLYGVDDPGRIPTYVTSSLESELREQYREAHLATIVPGRLRHGIAAPPPYGDWAESIGAAFDRRLFLYIIDTTPSQDAAILALLNSDPNQRRYTLGRDNCADFAANVLSVAYPGILRRNVIADFDMTTPKNLARLMDAYGQTHPEAHLQVTEIPQIPGTLRRSRPIRGSAETFVKTKRYLATLLVIQPEVMLADWVAYESKGRWVPGKDAQRGSMAILGTVLSWGAPRSDSWAREATTSSDQQTYSAASTSSRTASPSSGFLAK